MNAKISCITRPSLSFNPLTDQINSENIICLIEKMSFIRGKVLRHQ